MNDPRSVDSLSKAAVDVTIEGQQYTIRSDLDATQVLALAGYVDQVIGEIRKKAPTMAPSRMAILAALNIAEELFRIRENCAEVAQRTTELIDFIDRKCSPKAQELQDELVDSEDVGGF